MAYRFKSSDQSVSSGLRRIAASEFATVFAMLAASNLPDARKVHEARKCTKRLRALIRLTAVGFPGASDEIAALRACATSLSAFRDRAAARETLARLHLPGTAAAKLNAAFQQHHAPDQTEQAHALATFAHDLTHIERRSRNWTLEMEDWQAIAPGAKRGFRRFRRAMVNARKASGEDPVHELRKRGKDFGYHTLLLREICPPLMKAYSDVAERLGSELGDWRDLGLLQVELMQLPAGLLSTTESSASIQLITVARRSSLRRSQQLARWLTAETPDAYAARLRAWWKISF